MNHNLPLFCAGASLIWFGWYGFNAGSYYKASFGAGVPLLNTHIGACASGKNLFILIIINNHNNIYKYIIFRFSLVIFSIF